MADNLIPSDIRKTLAVRFADLEDTVQTLVFVKKGVNETHNRISVMFTTELAEISDKIKVKIHDMPPLTHGSRR